MRSVPLIILVYVFLGLLESLAHHLDATRFVPELTIAFVVYCALNFRVLHGALTVFAIGLLKDAFMGAGIIGMYVEVLLLVFLFLEFILKRYRVTSPMGLLLATLGGILAHDFLFLIFSLIFDAQFHDASLVLGATLPHLLMSLPLIPLELALIRRVDRLFFRQENRLFFD